MKASDLKEGNKVKAHYFNGIAEVVEVKEKQLVFKIIDNNPRLSNLNYSLKNRIKRISIINVQKMMDWNDEYKLEIV